MDWLTICQLLTISVSLLTLIVTSIIAIRTSKSQNVANIIASQRIRFLEQYRQLSSELLTLCTPMVLKNSKTDIKKIVHIAYSLNSIFRTCYKEEHEIVISINNLVHTTFNFIDDFNNSELEEELNNNILNLTYLLEIYDLAYWRFIIDQSIGDNFKVDDFEIYYSNATQRFSSDNCKKSYKKF